MLARRFMALAALVAAASVTLLIGVTIALMLISDPVGSVRQVEALILSSGYWGVAVAIGLMVLHTFVPFPAELVAFANGMIYGPVWGTAITWTGAMLGAFLAFGLTRALGRPFVEAVIAKKHWGRLDEWAAQLGWQVAFVARLVPVISFNLVNFAAGLTRMSWWTFAWSTGIGILPLTVVMVAMGHKATEAPWPVWVLALAAALALWALWRRWRGRQRRSQGSVR